MKSISIGASYKAAVDRWNVYVSIGCKVKNSKNRFDFYLAGQVLRQMIPHFSPEPEIFTLSHPDLHVGNIFVDEDFRIICLIDWGSASIGPMAELMATPKLANHFPDLTSTFRSAFDPGNLYAPALCKRADMMRQFTKFVRLLSLHDYPLCKGLYRLVYGMDAEDGTIARHLHELAKEDTNKALLVSLQEDDYTVEEIKAAELSAFGTSAAAVDSRSVARKLTVVADINDHFLTSSKSWQWIEAALDS